MRLSNVTSPNLAPLLKVHVQTIGTYNGNSVIILQEHMSGG